jgi:hypothetical protein
MKNELYISEDNYDTIIACFELLTEMVQGPCHENQIALSEGYFLELAMILLKQNDSISHFEKNKHKR